MSLTDLASLGSLVSAIAVLISLIYLSLQVKQAERNQQASIRALEQPASPEERGGGLFSLSGGSRKFMRYSYGDLLRAIRHWANRCPLRSPWRLRW